MQSEKKSNYILITPDENSFSEFYTTFLEKGITKNHIIIQFSDVFNITKKNLSLFLERKWHIFCSCNYRDRYR